jgi:hypothetical protein
VSDSFGACLCMHCSARWSTARLARAASAHVPRARPPIFPLVRSCLSHRVPSRALPRPARAAPRGFESLRCVVAAAECGESTARAPHACRRECDMIRVKPTAAGAVRVFLTRKPPHYASTRFEEQRQLHLPQKHKATVSESTLRVEMNGLEEQADNARPATSFGSPLYGSFFAKCGCKKHCMDLHGDHTATCI